jgi:hypothetical protein
VSLIKTNRTTEGAAALGTRAKDAAAQAVPIGKRAGSTAVRGVRQGVHGARGWAAPRLEDAADAVTASVAPKVSSALRSADAVTASVAPKVSSALRRTARQIRPDGAKPAKTGFRRLLNWRWLLAAGAMAAAAGTTAAVAMRRRYTSATEEAKNATGPADDESTAQSPDSAHPTTMGSEVNGRLTTPGR